MSEMPVVMCLLSGESEACDTSCSMFKKCWPLVEEKEKSDE
jgi:hypothetical protein